MSLQLRSRHNKSLQFAVGRRHNNGDNDIAITCTAVRRNAITSALHAIAQATLIAFFDIFLTLVSSALFRHCIGLPTHCNHHVAHYSGFSRISPSFLNRFQPNLQA